MNIAAPKPLSVKEWREQDGPKYSSVFAWRAQQLNFMREQPFVLRAAHAYYSKNPVAFITDWCDTYDPRNAGRTGKLSKMPFVLFEKQAELVRFLEACRNDEADGLIEKCRDFGATYVCCSYSVWAWRYVKGASIGWGSRKEVLVDKIGDMDSIFEKIRSIIRSLPIEFYPKGFNPDNDKYVSYMRIINPETDASITGEAGDNIGRGGRKLMYFKDESAHYERPEKIEASLSDNTRVQIDISSVNGPNNVFHRKREGGTIWTPETTVDRGKTRVFICDWHDHPGKTQEWYNERKAKFRNEGLSHIFAQEVERNYYSSVEGVIILPEYVEAAIDAHIKLKLDNADDGGWVAGLDVDDDGDDMSGFIARRGIVLRIANQWNAKDQGITARRVVDYATAWLKDFPEVSIQYDPIGVGAGVKTETNRLKEDDLLPEGITFVPWHAGDAVKRPFARIIEDDDETPMNKDFFHNLKAQATWDLRNRFFRTYQAVVEGVEHDPETLISIDSTIPFLEQLKKELSQPTRGLSTKLKMLVNKKPPGTKSPNLFDATVQCYFPLLSDSGSAYFGTTSG